MSGQQDIKISLRDRVALKTQRIIGWITFPIWGTFLILVMRIVGRYQISKIREIRKRYKELIHSTKDPILICANHLTKIDSALINWSLASVGSYMMTFKVFPWNIPERARYEGNIFLRFICYLGSCIPIDRGGDRDTVKNSLDKLTYLLKKGDAVTIFPEGKRSRDGKLDYKNFSYGAGRVLRTVKNCKVLCIYLRGEAQKKYSGIPKIGEKFYFDMKLIDPKSIYTGLRATRDIAQQIINQLKIMEQTYFAGCR